MNTLHRLDPAGVGNFIFGGGAERAQPEVAGYHSAAFVAQGGLGSVWRAQREADGVWVALKIPNEDDGEAAERLIKEAAALSRLHHRGIVQLFELTRERNGQPVIVMEFVRGADLTRILPARGFSFAEAVRLFLPILEAIEYAHAQGALHRDIKPANVLIGEDGSPKVTDFGLAKFLARPESMDLTQSGVVAGTMEYVAPERFEPGTQEGVAADVYALGIMFYEMLTGQPPRGSWLPLSRVKKLDVRLDALMAEATNPDPAERLKSVTAFRRRLKEILSSPPRYSGSPLVTLPVSVADAAWTLLGIYTALAGLFSLRRLEGGSAPGFYDLTGGNGGLIGAYSAFWAVSLLLGGLWLWQAVRLWIFRRVPVRESLPSPFGLRLGTGGGACWIVLAGQLICAWGGLLFLAELFFRSNHWVSAGTPFWERGLCVTARDALSPVSPWKWDSFPSLRTGSHLLREVQPGLMPDTLQIHASRSFIVFFQPLLMLLGLTGIGVGIAATGMSLVISWGQRRPKLLAAAILLGLLVLTGVIVESRNRQGERRRLFPDSGSDESGPLDAEQYANHGEWMELVSTAFGGQGDPGRLPFLVGDLFGERLSHDQKGVLTRKDLVTWLETEYRTSREHHRSIERESHGINKTGGPFPVYCRFEWFGEVPGGIASGASCTFRWRGAELRNPPRLVFNLWDTDSVTLYEVEPRRLDPHDLRVWLRHFLEELGRAGNPDLENYALPMMLAQSSDESRSWEPTPRSTMVEAFRRTRQRWASLEFFLRKVSSIERLSGGRWEVNASVNWLGVRADGEQEQPAVPMNWRMEIVPVKGSWRILQLDM